MVVRDFDGLGVEEAARFWAADRAPSRARRPERWPRCACGWRPYY
ncbi:hypothetical protein [Streptomyces sp. NPDC001020]